MKRHDHDVYADPDVRQALAKLFVDLNEQLPKKERWEISEEIQELSHRERRSWPRKSGRKKQTV